MKAPIVPAPRAIAQQVVIALVTTIVVAWVIGHTPGLRSWLKSETGDS